MTLVIPKPKTGLSSGDPDVALQGTGTSIPPGLESVFEYNGIILNNRLVIDKYRITDIGGFDDADIRDARENNPGSHGETAYNAFYGGRTITLTGRIEAHNVKKLRDMQMALRGAFASLEEKPLYIRGPGGIDNSALIMCRKSQPIQMKEVQNSYHPRRDFLISLRASNPRILGYRNNNANWTWDPEVKNLEVNPSAEVNVIDGGYTISGGTVTRQVASGSFSPLVGVAAFKLRSLALSQYMSLSTGKISASPGEYVSFTVATRAFTVPRPCAIGITCYDDTDNIVYVGTTAFAYNSTIDWTRYISEGVQIPDNTVNFTVDVYVSTGTTDTLPLYEEHGIDAFLAIKKPTLYNPYYFDGDTPGFKWDGTPHNSTSSLDNTIGRIIMQPENKGNFNADPTIVINGPITNPVLTNNTSNKSMSINATLLAGDSLTIKTDDRSIVDESGDNRFSYVDISSDWIELVPGENQIELTADFIDYPSEISISWRDTWM